LVSLKGISKNSKSPLSQRERGFLEIPLMKNEIKPILPTNQ
jgi:hypothetical protein